MNIGVLILKNPVALPWCIMAVNVVEFLKTNKEHPSIIKSAPHALGWVEVGVEVGVNAL